MAEIISFIAGCLFTLLLLAGCLFLSYKVLDYRESSEIRRTQKERAVRPIRVPTGGVIKPKTFQEMENDKNEELKAFDELLS